MVDEREEWSRHAAPWAASDLVRDLLLPRAHCCGGYRGESRFIHLFPRVGAWPVLVIDVEDESFEATELARPFRAAVAKRSELHLVDIDLRPQRNNTPDARVS